MWKISITFLFLLSTINCSPLDSLHNEVKEKKFEEELQKAIKFDDEILPTYRLPNDTRPSRYHLQLETNIDKGDFSFKGQVKIWIKVLQRTSTVTLHHRETTILKVEEFDWDNIVMRELSFSSMLSHEFLIIELGSTRDINEDIILNIQYNGTVRLDGGGFYRANYTEGNELIWYATTQFEVTDARHAMPCYDEPGIRAPIKLEIVHGSNYEAVANMPVEVKLIYAENITRTIFKETPSIQTYLLAFLISPFTYVSNNDSRVEQRIYAKPSSIDNGEADFAIGVVRSVLEKCEEHFGVDYPLTKMDHAAITQFNFGAMENIGLITYIENGILYNPNTPPLSQQRSQMAIIRLIAHEYVHQWFGNIVSPQWWSYTWLNEGFATLFASFIPHLLYPNMGFMDTFVTSVLPRAFSVDVGSSWSMNHYTEINDQLWSKFGGIGYQKSGSVLRMFQETLTIPTFAKGLKYYLNGNYMTAVTPDLLHSALQRAYNEDFPGNNLNIDLLMGMWENNAGYPILTIAISGNSMIISQRRYPTGNGEIYAIPLTFTTKTNKNFDQKTPKAWLTTREMTMTFESANLTAGDWIVFNIESIGYYRVDYATELWHAIIDQLIQNHEEINKFNRAMLQDEIFIGWSELGRVNAEDILNILSYLERENNPIVWSKAQNSLTRLHNRLLGTPWFDKFSEFLTKITKSHVLLHGYEAIEFEDIYITDLRSLVRSWNCRALDNNCLQHELLKFQQFYNTGDMVTSFNFCDALRNVDDEIYSSIINAIDDGLTVTQRNNYLQSLGCTLKRNSLLSFLGISTKIENNLTPNERRDIILYALSKSSMAYEETFEFFKNSITILSGILPVTSINAIMREFTNYANTETTINKVKDLLNELEEKSLLTSANLATLRSNLETSHLWHQANDDFVRKFLGDDEITTTTLPSTTIRTTTPSTASHFKVLSLYGMIFAIMFFLKFIN